MNGATSRAGLRAMVLVAGVALLVGCGTTLYEPLPGQPVARLRLVTSHVPQYGTDRGWATSFDVADMSTCPATPQRVMRFNLLGSAEARQVGMPLPPDAREKFSSEFVLPAGRPLAFTLITGTGRLLCQVAFRFTLEAGRDYEIESLWSTALKKCAASVRELKQVGSGVQRVRLTSARKLDKDNLCGAPSSEME